MYADLNIPWPTSHLTSLFNSTSNSASKKSDASRDKGKGKAGAGTTTTAKPDPTDVWEHVSEEVKEEVRQRVECAIRLGYTTIAFNLLIPQTLDPMLVAPFFPFPKNRPPFPDLDPRTTTIKGGKTVLQLSRLTMVMDEKIVGGKGCFGFATSQSSYLNKYDLLSALPLDLASFSHACLTQSTLNPHGIDLICLDLASSPRLGFHLPLHTVSKALSNSAAFEISYSSCTTLSPLSRTAPSAYTFPCLPLTPPISTSAASGNGSGGNAARRNLIANGKEVVRVCNGKVVISGGCGVWNELRAPGEVVNLGGLFGLPPDKAKHAISEHCRTTMLRGQTTRGTYRAVIGNPVIVTRTLAFAATTATTIAAAVPVPVPAHSEATQPTTSTATPQKAPAQASTSASAINTPQPGSSSKGPLKRPLNTDDEPETQPANTPPGNFKGKGVEKETSTATGKKGEAEVGGKGGKKGKGRAVGGGKGGQVGVGVGRVPVKGGALGSGLGSGLGKKKRKL